MERGFRREVQKPQREAGMSVLSRMKSFTQGGCEMEERGRRLAGGRRVLKGVADVCVRGPWHFRAWASEEAATLLV